MDQPMWMRLWDYVGEASLTYMLNIPLGSVRRSQPPSEPTVQQLEVAAALDKCVTQALSAAISGSTSTLTTFDPDTGERIDPRNNPFENAQLQFEHSLAAILVSPLTSSGRPRGSVFRSHAGGADPHHTSTDELSAVLHTIIIDSYPSLALSRWDPTVSPGLSLYRHELARRFEELVLMDEVLSRLYPRDTSPEMGPSGLIALPGAGGGIQLMLHLNHLLATAWVWAQMEELHPTICTLLRKADKVLNLQRQLVLEGSVAVPVRIGLAGVRIDDSQSISVGEVIVRSVEERDRRRLRQHRYYQNVQYGDLVLESEIVYSVQIFNTEKEIEDFYKSKDFRRLYEENHNARESMLKNIRLSAVLSSQDPDHAPLIVAPVWSETLNPLGASGPSALTLYPEFARSPYRRVDPLEPAEVEGWQEWNHRIDLTSLPTIAVDRLLMACAGRERLEDELIDSVLVWENLFSASPETTAQVCGSLAWILVPLGSPDERHDQFKELKKIYGLRSATVHGHGIIPTDKLPLAQKARGVSIRALRQLIANESDWNLLSFKDARARTEGVIIRGAPRPHVESDDSPQDATP